MFTLTWFLTAHILEYTSVNSCRLSAPLVWWLTFGILCTMYLLVLEVILFGFLVFMVLPFIMVSPIRPLLCMQLKLSLEAFLQHHITLPGPSSATESALHQARYREAPQVTRRPHPSCYLYSSPARRHVCTHFPTKAYSHLSSKATRTHIKKKICLFP